MDETSVQLQQPERTDQRTAAVVQHAIALMTIAGYQEAATYLRRFNVAPTIIERVLGQGRRRIYHFKNSTSADRKKPS
jgi:hypothetical protein